MKKLYFIATFVLTVLFVINFNPTSADAASRENCSTSYVRCQAVTIYPGDKIGYSSRTIYVPSGGEIYFGVSTYSDSVFQVGAYVYDGNLNQLDSVGASGGGGDGFDSVTAPHSGFYHIVLKSGDSTQGRSHARAYLQYYN
ncbi:hypothetical protein [Halobacillus amylolyticus]|uniref:Peptidase C-terminal archaeal/bacterial domain-containing protein n=1 Tax=Halobacillus amylolyticus TaxID=2932259 RepID=A0ABY4HIM1_9BACI|nr:hypothetical protein [Halobacillus amylolyticus]UOR14178.1 hypothetical protein MUO15_21065 [Halobacillus amylolyticus]